MRAAVVGALFLAAGSASGAQVDALLRAGAARDARVQVYVRVASTAAETLAELRARGLAIELVDERFSIVQGRVAARALAAIAALPEVRAVTPADPARRRAGSVTSEGDHAARADAVRTQGWDGTGIRVGVISLGADGMAMSQATGDLADVTIPADPRCGPGSGDEGTAMLEVVHDLAPGAQLFFSGAATSLEFIAAVRCLVDAGVNVLVDDLGFYGEPYFADGPVAVTVRDAIRAGVAYVTAAGNDAERHLQQSYRASLCRDLHIFGAGTRDCTNHVSVLGFDTLDCTLQWSDPFGLAADDYDLLLVDEGEELLTASDNPQTGSQDPIERIVWQNPGPDPRVLGLQIRKVNGEARVLKMFCQGGSLEYLSSSGTIFGHAGLGEAVTVGAIDVHDSALDDVEAFSSRGPVQLLFPVATRAKPDLAAFDGVTTAVPGFAPFIGTSAAAPHVAAVAALLRGKNPFLSPADVQDALRTSAVDVGPLGADDASGAGRVDALAAIRRVAPPECSVRADCPSACPIETCNAGACTHSVVRSLATYACTGQQPAPGVAARFDRACRLVARIPGARTPRKARRLGRKTERLLTRAIVLAGRAGRNDITPSCAAAVVGALQSAEAVFGTIAPGP